MNIKAFARSGNEFDPSGDWVPAEHQEGMTLRDYFASSFVSSGHVFKLISDGNTPALVAKQAYLMADAMLKARGK